MQLHIDSLEHRLSSKTRLCHAFRTLADLENLDRGDRAIYCPAPDFSSYDTHTFTAVSSCRFQDRPGTHQR